MAYANSTPFAIRGQAFAFEGVIRDIATGNAITGGLTGLTVTISKDHGATFNAPSQASPVTELGTTGYFTVDLDATDMTATVVLAKVTATNTGAIYFSVSIPTLDLSEVLVRADGATVKRFEQFLAQVFYAKYNNETIDNTSFARTLYKADGTTPMFAGTAVDGDAAIPSERGSLENIP
jgi:hypothetical protein